MTKGTIISVVVHNYYSIIIIIVMIQFEAKSLLCRTACKQKKRKPLYSSCSVGRAWEFKVSRRDTAVWSLWA